ncbi:uncharacterized protein UV8b_02662 [Ustilaginoidea virens]|uniref:Uncharacterized protein n=1 Tax=Ustilaginoidea virens TaxID=1159556 RepID=A0A8E5MG19_USTVR|nr:uncharacterized protein UV8b_02662 [Ustilaginoidea virens]QUC18421.1 hypothetical protein UV8b_02662 [Ustilaginoidea virens]
MGREASKRVLSRLGDGDGDGDSDSDRSQSTTGEEAGEDSSGSSDAMTHIAKLATPLSPRRLEAP